MKSILNKVGVKLMKIMSKAIIILLSTVILISCKPSEKYVGDWYAVSDDGEEFRIHFSTDKTMTVIDEAENQEVYEINQTVSGIQNSTRYFKVEVDGASHYLIFDNTKDEDNAKFYVQTNLAEDFSEVVGNLVYVLNRNDYPIE